MNRWIAGVVVGLMLAGSLARAQGVDTVFIQVEARSTLVGAQAAVRNYNQRFDNVAGFALGGGWYGVALGPYTREEAAAALRTLRAARLVPADAFVEEASDYGQRFWPVGPLAGQAPQTGQGATGVTAQTPQPQAPVVQAPQAQPEIPEETPRQARASESRLSRDVKKELQVALQWAGFYRGAIDAAFGRGTRGAMAAWQDANGFDRTGVLSTRQRAVLLQQYNAVLDGLDLRLVDDLRAGISLELPMGVLDFDRYEAPFAIYAPTSDNPEVQVVLISQPGTRATMGGLYEILQTLEIVPLEGQRGRERDSFLLIGANDRIVSHTEVTLSRGQIKGFMLVWPAGNEERRTRVLARMQQSFQRLDGVLDPARVTDAGQGVDLVSGLAVRQPRANASGFFVATSGAVVTTAEAVAGCTRITLDGVHEARVVATDPEFGIALLTPEDSIAPRGIAALRTDAPRRQSEVAVAGYPFGGVLSAPTLTFGTLEDLQGLRGETELRRLALAAAAGDAGGPVLDAGGSVLGMLLPPQATGGQVLPPNVTFAAEAGRISALMREAGLTAARGDGLGTLAPEDLTTRAANMTVFVSCWE